VLLGTGAWTAWFLSRPAPEPRRLTSAWLWLRDSWGAVWAIRFSERWNAAAQFYGWPVRLRWRGFDPPNLSKNGDRSLGDAAEDQFRILLRRFADPDEVFGPQTPPAHPPD
jgi:hypothetical protein